MPDIALKQEAESYLGAAIEGCEWDKAKEQAERKLNGIIDREGDADGARREPWYLAQLVAEAVRSSRFSTFTIMVYDFLAHLDDEEIEIKKGQPVS